MQDLPEEKENSQDEGFRKGRKARAEEKGPKGSVAPK